MIDMLKSRFFAHMARHPRLTWEAVEARLRENEEALLILRRMEESGGEPDVIGVDDDTGRLIYCDCSAGSCITAFKRDVAYTRRLLTTYPDRFLFARDYHDSRLDEFLATLDLPQDVAELIYHGNAERLAAPEREVK